MNDQPERPSAPARRFRPAVLAIGLALASQIGADGPGHAAGLTVSSETLTIDVVGNPP